MSDENTFLLKAGKLALGFCASVLLGIAGGSICGAAILSLNVLLGRSGTTGKHFGDWNWAVAVLGLWYGGFFGAFVTPLAYVLLVRKIGFQRALWAAVEGTIIGGFAGAVLGPAPLAVITGIVGFFVGVCFPRPSLCAEKCKAEADARPSP